MTIKEAAAHVGLSEKTLYRAVLAGTLTHARPNPLRVPKHRPKSRRYGAIRTKIAYLDAWMEGR